MNEFFFLIIRWALILNDVGSRILSCVNGVEKFERTSATFAEVLSYVKFSADALNKSASVFKISETENTET